MALIDPTPSPDSHHASKVPSGQHSLRCVVYASPDAALTFNSFGDLMFKGDGSILAIGAVSALVGLGWKASRQSGSRTTLLPTTSLKIPLASSLDNGVLRVWVQHPSDEAFFSSLGLTSKDGGSSFSAKLTPFILDAFKRRYAQGKSLGFVPADGYRSMAIALAEAEQRLGLDGLRPGALERDGLTAATAARVSKTSPSDSVGVLEARPRFSQHKAGAELETIKKVNAWADGYGATSILLLGDGTTDRMAWLSLGFAPLFERDGIFLLISRSARSIR
jgi:hypothetical protein